MISPCQKTGLLSQGVLSYFCIAIEMFRVMKLKRQQSQIWKMKMHAIRSTKLYTGKTL